MRHRRSRRRSTSPRPRHWQAEADVGLGVLDRAAAAAREEAALYGAALDRVRAACLLSLGRRDEARASLDRALAVAAVSQSLLYEQLLIRRARAAVVDGAEKDEELHEAERLAQLLGIAA